MHLWHVKYKSRFNSSSGMSSYSDKSDGQMFVATEQATNNEVIEKVKAVLGNQHEVINIDGTIYLGILRGA